MTPLASREPWGFGLAEMLLSLRQVSDKEPVFYRRNPRFWLSRHSILEVE